MKIRALLTSLLFLLIAVFGCSVPERKKHETWLDIAEISEQVVKTVDQTAVLDAATTEGPADYMPASQDLSAKPPDGGNPYMSDVIMQQLMRPPTPAALAGGGLMLNFDNADIYEFIQAVAGALDLDYIIEPKVKGVVNIRSRKEIPADQLFSVFKKILNMNGLDLRNEGDYYYIFMSKKPSSVLLYDADRVAELQDSPRLIIQVMPIMNLASKEVTKLIEPYLSEQGTVYDLTDLNTIIIADYETNIIDALLILAKLDVSPLSSLKIKLVKVEKAALFKLYEELQEILAAMHVNKKDYEGVSVIPLERLNSLLILGNSEYLLENTQKWITELDVVPSTGRDNIYIYNVRNSVASELESLVSNLIAENGAVRAKPARTPAAPAQAGKAPTRAAAPPTTIKGPTAASASYAGLKFAGEPLLLADDSRNAILIRALPADYSRLVKLLERLDSLPRQVLIEVIIAEVTLSDTWSLGIEWGLSNNKVKLFNDTVTGSEGGEDVISTDRGNDPFNFPHDLLATFGATGLTLSRFNDSEKFYALLKTFATDSNLSILSSPQVLVLNNETATVNVGSSVPIVTSFTDRGTDVTAVTDKSVQYRDTGIILTVTPRINYNGIIILDIDQQITTPGETPIGDLSPPIDTKQIKTKLTIKDGQSIVMGGLIQKNHNLSGNGIPVLKDIPILGWLFKSKSDSIKKTELLLMITPHVIESENVLDQYVNEFNKKLAALRKKLTE